MIKVVWWNNWSANRMNLIAFKWISYQSTLSLSNSNRYDLRFEFQVRKICDRAWSNWCVHFCNWTWQVSTGELNEPFWLIESNTNNESNRNSQIKFIFIEYICLIARNHKTFRHQLWPLQLFSYQDWIEKRKKKMRKKTVSMFVCLCENRRFRVNSRVWMNEHEWARFF